MIPPIAYIVVIALSLGTIAGFKASSILNEAEQAKILKLEKEKFLAIQKVNTRLQQELLDSEGQIKIVYKTVVKTITEGLSNAQKTNSICNLSTDTKRMLNNFISPGTSTTSNITDSGREFKTFR